MTRSGAILHPDSSRVLLRRFNHGDAARSASIIGRILEIPEQTVITLLAGLRAEFATRHQNLDSRFRERFDELSGHGAPAEMSDARKALIGAYFLSEYSLESAALFNPSIVPHPDQSGVVPGSLRFILSLRATGEGHISSVTFRTGVVDSRSQVSIDTPQGFLTEPRQVPNARYERPLFARKLTELGLDGDFARDVLEGLAESFTLPELRAAIDASLARRNSRAGASGGDDRAAQGIWLLGRSNYEVRFESGEDLSRRILFPATPSQRNGIEDARFVRFEDEGETTYFATFTAYDGRVVMPELVETLDFLRFRFTTLNGPAARNKGMALFPRKIGGQYAMLSRQDGENISIMFSPNVHFWNERVVLMRPEHPWESVQTGNCGPPMETPEGWLVLSHGVGPLRKYCIGAFLLDLEDPSRVIGRSHEPLLQPLPAEREGYVPNVVYTCGALIHRGTLHLPYGLADHATGFASMPVDEVLRTLR